MNGKSAGTSTQTELVDIEWAARRLGVTVRHVRPGREAHSLGRMGVTWCDPVEIEAWITDR